MSRRAASLTQAVKDKNQIGRVIVLEENQNVDISRASDHGELVMLFDSAKRNPKCFDNEWLDIVVEKLEDINYNPSVDYILIAGHMASIAMLVATAVREFIEEENEQVKILIWNSWYDKYVEKEV